MKGQFDYKLPKRMKKRRQLDALVDTMKLPRSRKNSNSAQELLDCNSDSSDIDEFSMPQVSSKRKNRCCVCQSIVARIGLFMVSMACLTTCVGLIWVQWHIRHELNSLRKQVDSVQNADKSASEMLKIQGQLLQMNSTIMTLKTGAGGLQEISDKILNLTKELKEVKDSQKAKAGETSSASLSDLPKKVEVLTDSITEIADLKNDLKNFEDAQKIKNEGIESRLKAVEAGHEAMTSTNGAETGIDKQFGDMLKEELDNLNRSFSGGLLSVGQELAAQESKVSALEKAISEMSTPAVDEDAVNAMVSKAVQQLTNASTSQTAQTSLAGTMVENGEFLAFKEDMLQNILEINGTVHILDSEFDDLAKRLDLIDASLGNITAVVGQLKPASPTGSPTEAVVQKNTPSVKFEASTSATPSKQELHVAFIRLSSDGVQVDSEAARKIVGDKVDLKQYDTNGDGVFSEAELAQSLGLVTTVPPRR